LSVHTFNPLVGNEPMTFYLNSPRLANIKPLSLSCIFQESKESLGANGGEGGEVKDLPTSQGSRCKRGRSNNLLVIGDADIMVMVYTIKGH
jgi:hypothetical protein